MKISIRNIAKSFGHKQVIRPMNLELTSGRFTTLLGPSGCGKTTLLRMIAGLEAPDSGEIWFDGRCVFSAERGLNVPPEARGLSFVFQDFALWPHMTVFENVAFGLRARRDTENLAERVRGALAAVQLSDFERRYPHQLSGGQQQRVAFARAIVVRPACILFDEPLSALDALLREEMRAEVRQLAKSLRATAVFVTHDQLEAMSLSDDVAVMQNGHIDQMGTPEEIYACPKTAFVAKFIGQSNWLDERRLFRPEHLSLQKREGGDRYAMTVESAQYLGSRYEYRLQSAAHRWIGSFPERLAVGAEIGVYIDPKNLITVEK